MENKNIGIIIALGVAVLLVLSGIYLYDPGAERPNRGSNQPFLNLDGKSADKGQTVNIPPPSESDHLRGPATAAVVIIEYSDLECPFCKRFHETMNQVVAEYGNKVAWVYRHFPLEGLHQKAKAEAEAVECAAQIGGNEGFWKYLDKIFAVTPSNDGLDLSLLPVLAQEVGLDRTAFEACLKNNDFDAKISAQIAEAESNGGTGTPFPILIGPDGKQTALPGALPFSQLKTLIDAELAKVK